MQIIAPIIWDIHCIAGVIYVQTPVGILKQRWREIGWFCGLEPPVSNCNNINSDPKLISRQLY